MADNDQFTTIQEAQAIAAEINQHPEIGGGIKPYNPLTALEQPPGPAADDPQASGIYVALYGGPFPTPQDGEELMYMFRFNNGFQGYIAGLAQQMIANNPTRWPEMMALEVNA